MGRPAAMRGRPARMQAAPPSGKGAEDRGPNPLASTKACDRRYSFRFELRQMFFNNQSLGGGTHRADGAKEARRNHTTRRSVGSTPRCPQRLQTRSLTY